MIEHHDPKPPDTKAVGRYEHTWPDRKGTGIDDLPKLLIVERDVTKMDLMVVRGDLRSIHNNFDMVGVSGQRHDDPALALHTGKPRIRSVLISPYYWERWESEWVDREGVPYRSSDWTLKHLIPGDFVRPMLPT
jgi:hypothetical protein